ncbi:MAG: hypothetical protein Q8941_03255 [Bacteroidota bacterium]|nr:hypothetical protein [Bacteroidota bacterium]
MKKLFVVLAVASLGFVACNNESKDADAEAKRVADSTHQADSIAKATATADSLAKATAPAVDTTHKPADSSKMKAKK